MFGLLVYLPIFAMIAATMLIVTAIVLLIVYLLVDLPKSSSTISSMA